MAFTHSFTGLTEEEIDKLESSGADACTSCTTLCIVEGETRRPLALRLFLCEFFLRVFTFGADVAWHTDHKIRHQGQNCVLGGMDCACDIQTPFVEDVES